MVPSCSLIKMMYCMFEKNKEQKLTMNQLQHCLKRNFGGKSNVSEIVDMFLADVPAKYLGTKEIVSIATYMYHYRILLLVLCICIHTEL